MEMGKEWPPLRTCPQYETGLIRRLVNGKYSWEDEGKGGDWFALYKRPVDEDDETNLYKRPVKDETMREELRIANKFLHQVRTTRGYGVTCSFPLHHSSFRTLSKSEWERYETVKDAVEKTPTHISHKTGQDYELVEIENVVRVALRLMYLLTFVAKKPNSVPQTFLSMVCQMPGDEGVMECILKPDGGADWGANEDKLVFTYDF